MQYIGKYSTYQFREVLEQYSSHQISIVQDGQQQFTVLDLLQQLTEIESIQVYNTSLKHFFLIPFIDYGNSNQRTYFLYHRCKNLRQIINNKSLQDQLQPQIFNVIRQMFLIINEIGLQVQFVISLDTIYIENIENNSFINVKIINCIQSIYQEPNFYRTQIQNQNEHIYALSQLWQYLRKLYVSQELTSQEQNLMQMMSKQPITQQPFDIYISQFNSFIGRPSISQKFIQLFDIYQNVIQIYETKKTVIELVRTARIKDNPNIIFISNFLKKLEELQKSCRDALIKRQLLEESKVSQEWNQINELSLIVESKMEQYKLIETDFDKQIGEFEVQLQLCQQLIEKEQPFSLDGQNQTLAQLQIEIQKYSKPNIIKQVDLQNSISIRIQQIPKVAFDLKCNKIREEALNQWKQNYLKCKNELENFYHQQRQNLYSSEEENVQKLISSLIQDLETQYQNAGIQNLQPIALRATEINQNFILYILNELQNFDSFCKNRNEEFIQQINNINQQLLNIRLARNPQQYQTNKENLMNILTNDQLIENLAIILDQQENNYEQTFKDMLYDALKIN